MPGACTVSCLIYCVSIIFACIAAADAADCSPVDRLPFAAILAQVYLSCSFLAIFFIITLLRSFQLIQTIILLLLFLASDSLISASFNVLLSIISTNTILTIVLAFLSFSLSSPPLSSLSFPSIDLMLSLYCLIISAVSRSRLACASSLGCPCGGDALFWCRLCANPRMSVSIDSSSAMVRRPVDGISLRCNRGRRFRFRGRFVF